MRLSDREVSTRTAPSSRGSFFSFLFFLFFGWTTPSWRDLFCFLVAQTGTRCAVDVAHGLVALLAEDCVCELLEHRPQDAARLSVKFASVLFK